EDEGLTDVSFYCDEDKDCKDANKICDLNTHQCVEKNRPILFVDPQVINFGAVFFGQWSKRTFKIQNVGSADLRITMIDFESGTNPEPPLPPRFKLNIPISIPGTVPSGSSIDVEVEYCQDDATPDKGNILIISNDENKPQYKLPVVSAYKDSPDFAIVDEKDFNKRLWPPLANPYQYTVDIGNTDLGKEIKKRIYFTNVAGEAILEISKLYLTKTSASNNTFSMKIFNNIDSQKAVNTPIYDNPGEVYFIEIAFRCNEDKFDEASVITFNTNDPDVDTISGISTPDDGSTTILIKAQCNYQGPKITLDRQKIDFGTVQVNDEKTEQIVAKNDGKVNLVITEAAIDNPGTSLTLLVNNQPVQTPVNITPGGSVTFTVKYAPRSIETVSTRIIIKSNDSLGNDNISVPITANAIDPTISVDNSSLDFGTILYDSSQNCSSGTKTINISNAGFGQLVISSIDLTIGSSTDFVLSNLPNFPLILDSAQKISLNVTFVPSVGSQINGQPT
ncbi:MAG: choice-of-anchor D domain-containing protein, partial [Deltaproteobacteria bacterium]|nr:choice-of-anchor D domain-containing protein [Deltaproteobacteria bacterium]